MFLNPILFTFDKQFGYFITFFFNYLRSIGSQFFILYFSGEDETTPEKGNSSNTTNEKSASTNETSSRNEESVSSPVNVRTPCSSDTELEKIFEQRCLSPKENVTQEIPSLDYVRVRNLASSSFWFTFYIFHLLFSLACLLKRTVRKFETSSFPLSTIILRFVPPIWVLF